MSRAMCDLCDKDCDDGEWSVVCANCMLTVHDAKGLAEEVKRLADESEALRSLLKRGATLSYRGKGWRVVGLSDVEVEALMAVYDTEDAALEAAVKAVREEAKK